MTIAPLGSFDPFIFGWENSSMDIFRILSFTFLNNLKIGLRLFDTSCNGF